MSTASPSPRGRKPVPAAERQEPLPVRVSATTKRGLKELAKLSGTTVSNEVRESLKARLAEAAAAKLAADAATPAHAGSEIDRDEFQYKARLEAPYRRLAEWSAFTQACALKAVHVAIAQHVARFGNGVITSDHADQLACEVLRRWPGEAALGAQLVRLGEFDGAVEGFRALCRELPDEEWTATPLADSLTALLTRGLNDRAQCASIAAAVDRAGVTGRRDRLKRLLRARREAGAPLPTITPAAGGSTCKVE